MGLTCKRKPFELDFEEQPAILPGIAIKGNDRCIKGLYRLLNGIIFIHCVIILLFV